VNNSRIQKLGRFSVTEYISLAVIGMDSSCSSKAKKTSQTFGYFVGIPISASIRHG